MALLILFAAAALEAGGDAVVRSGLKSSQMVPRLALFLAGGLLLFAYGWVVNAPPWDFGKLLGIYVVFFFIVAQVISFFAFGQKPSLSLLVGGLLIVSGGLVIALSATISGAGNLRGESRIPDKLRRPTRTDPCLDAPRSAPLDRAQSGRAEN